MFQDIQDGIVGGFLLGLWLAVPIGVITAVVRLVCRLI